MTFSEFKDHVQNVIWINKPEHIRLGQSLMNYLYEIWPNEYNRISDFLQKDIDCFYVDDRIDNTLEHLKMVWSDYPN